MSPPSISKIRLPGAVDLFCISEHGFLPARDPLTCLPQEQYEPWEKVMECLPKLIKTDLLRQRIDKLSVISASFLECEDEWQRAYLLLTLMAQGYIWSSDQPSERIPPAITKPLLQVAKHLEVQPVLSYAALNLWNWKRCGADIRCPENLTALHTATGTEDESWFLMISTAMEARAGPLIDLMLQAMQTVDNDSAVFVVQALITLTQELNEIGALLERMDERCDPFVFYHHIRPYLAGSLNMEAAGLPNGVFYDEGHGRGTWRRLRGGSNGQSSLIQFLDAVLGVQHVDRNEFHKEMRSYMPGPHTKFLERVTERANIRGFVGSHRDNVELLSAYDAAVNSLTIFRNKHIQLVARYIILPSRLAGTGSPHSTKSLVQASSGSIFKTPAPQNLVGTGGTQLVPFLRQARDETAAAALR